VVIAIYFSLLISLDSVWFVVGCFEGFFLSFHPRGKSLNTPSHAEDLPYLNAEKQVGFLQLGLPQSGCERVENDPSLLSHG